MPPPIDTSRPGGPDDVKALLRQIKSNLEDQGTSIGVLIREVRDSMLGRTENTVKTTIQQEFSNLHRDMTMIHDALRGGSIGGGTRGGTPGGLAGPDRRFQEQELDALERIARRVEELEAELAVLQRGGGGGQGGGLGGAFNVGTLQTRFRELDGVLRSLTYQQADFVEKVKMIKDFTFREGGALNTEYINRQKQAIFNLTSLASKSLDLISIFERLGAFVKTQIVDRYSTMFQRDRSLGLTGMQMFGDDLERILQHGLSNMGVSYKVTEDAIKKNAEGGGGSTMLLYGQNIAQMSQKFDQIWKTMEARGANPIQTFSPQELLQFMQNQANFMRQSQTFNQMRPDQQTEMMTRGLLYWADIAKFTGVSAAKLEEMAKKSEEEANELQALGVVTAEQRTYLRQNLTAVEAQFGPEAKKWIVEFIRANREPGLFMGQNPSFVVANQFANGTLLPALQQMTNEALKEQTDRRGFLANLAGIMNQTSGAGGGTAVAAIAAQNRDVGRILGTFQAGRGFDPNQIRNMEIQKTDDAIRQFAAGLDAANARWPQFLSLLGGVAGWAGDVAKFGIEIGLATMVLRNFWRAAPAVAAAGGMAAGGGSGLAALGSMAGAAGRVAGPVLGGAGAAVGAYAAGAPATGIVGAGLGGAGGAWGGMALGTAIAGPIGTVIGGVLGSLLGGYLGEKAGSAVSPAQSAPAVPLHTTAYGPGAADVAASTASTYQDSSLSLLTQIVQTGASGNFLLGQVYGELARQTGYLRGDPNGAGGNIAYGGQGLITNIVPTGGMKASDSNPYSGPSA